MFEFIYQFFSSLLKRTESARLTSSTDINTAMAFVFVRIAVNLGLWKY